MGFRSLGAVVAIAIVAACGGSEFTTNGGGGATGANGGSTGVGGTVGPGAGGSRTGGYTGTGGKPGTGGAILRDGGLGGGPSVDASPVDVVVPQTWCTTQGPHFVCSDFDGPAPLAVWKIDTSGGAVDTVAALSVSEPRSLVCSTAPTDPSLPVAAHLIKPVPLTGSDSAMVIEFSIYFPTVPTQEMGTVIVARARFGTVFVALAIKSGNTYVLIDDAETNTNIATVVLGGAPAANQWWAVKFAVQPGVNGTGAYDIQPGWCSGFGAANVTTASVLTDASAEVGLVQLNAIKGVAVHCDNVTVN